LEDKVKNGDLPGAATEWNTLPSDAKQASAAFKQSLEARIRVEELVGSALSKAVLTGANSTGTWQGGLRTWSGSSSSQFSSSSSAMASPGWPIAPAICR
jgi:hypothetical protein